MPGQSLRQCLAEGMVHQRDGNYPAALLAYRKVLEMDPRQLDAWCNMGSVLRELGRREEAWSACERALEIDPDSTATLCNLGSLKGDAGDFQGALELLQRVVRAQPDHFLAHLQLGWVLFGLDRLAESLAADDRAVALGPTVAAAHLNRGYTLMKLGRLPEAEAAIMRSLELDPGLALGHWNLAFVRLLDGRFDEAWPHYAWRWKIRESLPSQRHFTQPLWEGEPLEGRTILIWAEQGFGDTIQFVRYLPQVKRLGARVLLQVQPALVALMGTCPGADLVLDERQPAPAFDVHLPILSLPQVLRSTLADLPAEVPYLACPDASMYAPKSSLVEAVRSDGRTRIGLAWHGNPNQKDNRTRSLDPALLAPLATLPGVSWFNLQKYAPGVEPRPLPSAFKAQELDPLLETFADTAYALEHMDLVISVDTAVAHLAGALGRPALVLLSFSPDWRWLMRGEDCPWYPTFRLYRQPCPGDWPSVIQKVLSDLA